MTATGNPVDAAVESFLRENIGTDRCVAVSNDLFVLLGCPHLGTRPGCSVGIIVPKEQPAENVEAAKRCLPSVLAWSLGGDAQSSGTISSLLAAIGRHGYWRELLRDESSAYTLACALLVFVEAQVPSLLSKKAIPTVREILNEWLMLDSASNQIEPVEKLAALFFGEPWVLFADREELLGAIAHRERPLFLPGLGPVQSIGPNMSLPSLDIA